MDVQKIKKLNTKGWKVGDAADFLGLTPEEVIYIEIKISMGNKLKEKRKSKNLTQTQLANAVGSSQSRIAKMETGDPSISLDLLLKTLLFLGISKKEMGVIFR